ncbi:MAG: DegQ family serine endoprotease [Alphaproteobacteria bacterium]
MTALLERPAALAGTPRLRSTAGLTLGLLLGWSAAAGAAMPPEGFADLVEKVSPAVVTVEVTGKAERQMGGLQQSPFPEGSPFDDFFKRFGLPTPGPQAPSPGERLHGLGSGFVIDQDGYIVTNNHVIDKAEKVQVKFADGRELDARVVGADAATDVALLKIEDGGSLPLVTLGNSDKVRVGDTVLAVGNPFGLGGTVTAGIVSALGRDIDAGPYVDFIQTDAAINRGNSGGPLFDVNGEVIGINSVILSPSGGSVGVGFAIPSNLVKTIVAQLKDTGTVERGWLGVTIQSITPDIADAMSLDEAKGALVANVAPGSPSDGVLKQGDVIESFNGQVVATSQALPKLVAAAPVGERAEIGILRGGRSETVEVEIGQLPSAQMAALGGEPAAPEQSFGLALAPLTPEMRQSLGLDQLAQGVAVTDVDPSGPAADAGIRPGDVIEQVGSKPVRTPQEVQAAIASLPNDSALFLINRHGNSLFVGVTRSVG